MEYTHLCILKNGETIKFIKSEQSLDCDAVIGKDGKIYEILLEEYMQEENANNIPQELILDYVGTVNYVEKENEDA